MHHNPQRPLPRGALSAVEGARSTEAVALPHLYRPSEVAEALGCSEWWVKEQARRRRIPFTRVGGAYRFTAEHFGEIIRSFEEPPLQPVCRGVAPVPVRSRRERRSAEPSSSLRARPPRRALKAEQSALSR
ncbi:hypothetical protein GCM10010214_54250 [Streptomyces abikoensis]|uniref:helix-turn-helix domain-containing protein n=1 Tax=Streptomyces abikoensis TaxID=97398 RepID=UPI001673C3C8|nr:hypothetical protein GCM10010214_54250 [Streptomyces abikoensis]